MGGFLRGREAGHTLTHSLAWVEGCQNLVEKLQGKALVSKGKVEEREGQHPTTTALV